MSDIVNKFFFEQDESDIKRTKYDNILVDKEDTDDYNKIASHEFDEDLKGFDGDVLMAMMKKMIMRRIMIVRGKNINEDGGMVVIITLKRKSDNHDDEE